MRLDRKNLRNHIPWLVMATFLVGGLVGWYALESAKADRWLRGGSLPGLVCGLVAGSIIAFEMLLWPRKIFRAWRLIGAKHWLAAHLWFGLASLPLAYVHCGFHTGGLLPTLFLILFTLTVISGIFGWVLQHILPKLILKNVTAETICSQIPQVSQQNLENAYTLLVTVVGPPPSDSQAGRSGSGLQVTEADQAAHDQAVAGSMALEYRNAKPMAVVMDTVRSGGRIRGRVLRTTNVKVDAKHAYELWDLYDRIRPYLQRGRRSGSELADPLRADAFFSAARSQCGSTCHEIIDSLEEYCDERRQFDVQATLNAWLHGWLPIHIGMSVAVTVLLVGHILTALRY